MYSEEDLEDYQKRFKHFPGRLPTSQKTLKPFNLYFKEIISLPCF